MSKLKVYLITLIACISLIGCQNDRAENEQASDTRKENPYSVSYQSNQSTSNQRNNEYNTSHIKSKDELLDGYLSNLDKPENDKSRYAKYFYNDNAQKINKEINKLPEVDLTQTMVTDQRQIIVSVMLNQEKYGPNTDKINVKIKRRIQEMYPQYEVIVYTDAIYWNKMKDLDAGTNGNDQATE